MPGNHAAGTRPPGRLESDAEGARAAVQVLEVWEESGRGSSGREAEAQRRAEESELRLGAWPEIIRARLWNMCGGMRVSIGKGDAMLIYNRLIAEKLAVAMTVSSLHALAFYALLTIPLSS